MSFLKIRNALPKALRPAVVCCQSKRVWSSAFRRSEVRLCTPAEPNARPPKGGTPYFRFSLHYGLVLCLLILVQRAIPATIPPAEKLLPDDTLLVVTTPDYRRLCSILSQSPQARLWEDPALKAFKDNFIAKWTEDIVKPVERDLNIDIRNYADLAEGQVTLAFTRSGDREGSTDASGFILLVDAKDKITPLRSMVAGLRKKWVDAGRTVRMEKIRDFEFLLITLSSNDVPLKFKQFLPLSPEPLLVGPEAGVPRSAPKTELVIGRADSLLIVANSLKNAERVVARLAGIGAPTLGDVAAYHANHVALFRDAPDICLAEYESSERIIRIERTACRWRFSRPAACSAAGQIHGCEWIDRDSKRGGSVARLVRRNVCAGKSHCS